MLRIFLQNCFRDMRRSFPLGPAGALLAIVVVTAAIRLPLLAIPFERDEGEYAYIAWRLGFGELPYLDWFDQKPPAIFWIYRLALSLPLDEISAVHLLGMLFACGSAFCVYLICRRFLGQGWGMVAGLAYAVFAADPRIQGTAANTEIFMQLPLLASHVLFLRAAQDGRDGKLILLLIGLANAVAVACKQVALVNVLFLLGAYPAMIDPPARWRKTRAFVLFFTLGFGLCWGGIIIYFLSRQALGALLANVFTHNFLYVQAVSLAGRLQYFLGTAASLARSQLLLWLFALVGVAGIVTLGRRPGIYLLGWILSSLVGISAGGYYFPHYFQQGLPALVILAVIGGWKAFSVITVGHLRPLAKQTALVCLLIMLPAMNLYPFLFHYTPLEAARKIYPGNYFAETPAIGAELALVTKPADRIFIYGAEPELFFYSRRASATRYIFLFPLYVPFASALQAQLQAAEEITRTEPEVVVYSPNQLFFRTGSQQYFSAWIKQYLAANYYEWAYLTRSSRGTVRTIHASGNRPPAVARGDALVGILLRKNNGKKQWLAENVASAQ
jgi:4-amino-4-deoxy-L-arabinose transferase-like glycosyltransferase